MGIGKALRIAGKATADLLYGLLPPSEHRQDLAAAVGYIECLGSPYGAVTPDFVGQRAFDMTMSTWYVAKGLTPTAWRPMMEGALDAAGNLIGLADLPATRATLTTNAALTTAALGAVTPFNSVSAGTLTLPDAATCWALTPHGLIVVAIKNVGIPIFAAGGSDSLRATSGVAAGVQYGMIAAQIISATEWALA